MVPAEYFELIDEAGGEGALRGLFARRYVDAAGDDDEVGSEWEGYLSGAYGVCLKHVTPENIARKSALVAEIEGYSPRLSRKTPTGERAFARAWTSSTSSSAPSRRTTTARAGGRRHATVASRPRASSIPRSSRPPALRD